MTAAPYDLSHIYASLCHWEAASSALTAVLGEPLYQVAKCADFSSLS